MIMCVRRTVSKSHIMKLYTGIKNQRCMINLEYFLVRKNGKFFNTTFDNRKTCFLQSPKTSTKIIFVSKVKIIYFQYA